MRKTGFFLLNHSELGATKDVHVYRVTIGNIVVAFFKSKSHADKEGD